MQPSRRWYGCTRDASPVSLVPENLIPLLPQLENDPMVSFIPLNITEEDSIEVLMAHIDNAIQYGEDLEPKPPKELEDEEPSD